MVLQERWSLLVLFGFKATHPIQRSPCLALPPLFTFDFNLAFCWLGVVLQVEVATLPSPIFGGPIVLVGTCC